MLPTSGCSAPFREDLGTGGDTRTRPAWQKQKVAVAKVNFSEGRGGRGEEGGFSCLKHSDMQSLFTNCALLIALGTTATSAFSAPAPLSSFRLGVSAGEKRGTLPLRAHVARSSGTARIAMGWADPDWKWGYGNGKAHNAAYVRSL